MSEPPEKDVDRYPPPPGNVTHGTSAHRDTSCSYSAVNSYSAEVAIFRAEEFSKMQSPNEEDFLIGTSAADGELRYIRKAFIESVCAHEKGCIVRTFSGDFHVIREDSGTFERSMGFWMMGGAQETELELLKTKVRELERVVETLIAKGSVKDEKTI